MNHFSSIIEIRNLEVHEQCPHEDKGHLEQPPALGHESCRQIPACTELKCEARPFSGTCTNLQGKTSIPDMRVPPIQCSSCALAPPSSSHLTRRGRDSHLHTMRRRAVTCHVSHISRLRAPSQVLKDLHWIPHPASAPAEGISTQESCVMSLCSSLALKHSAGSI